MKLRTITFTAVGLVAALASSACGGGSSASSSQPPSQPTTQAAAKPPAPGSQGELDAYLKKVLRPRLRGNRSIDKCGKPLNHLAATPDSTWDRAAKVCRQTAQQMRRTADTISAIVPPHPLARAHLAYAASDRAGGLIYADLASVLRRHQFLNWDMYNAQFNRTQGSVTAYRVALIAYAARHQLRLPHWVHTIGGK